jgi:cobalt/nickel transport system permease protein
MHIPDGYLSPSTCAAFYVSAAPFWYVALKRVRRLFDSRMVPLLSVFAAFSFVIMMFNLPLPGGTTGHAVGMGIAAIVLGPWAAILAISAALSIQALLFGDGGILSLGANCFNMAIVGSLVAYGVYRLMAGNSALTATRRVVAGAVAGYCAINASALCAAIEFGLQPFWFHDAHGAPLYAPYPLSISIPAMMIGHLTYAGFAELIATAGIVTYLQRSDSALLRFTAPHVAQGALALPGAVLNLKKLWLGLAALLILTPLGILAVGSAWGEWGPHDFADQVTRGQMAAASGNHAAPIQAPAGLEHLAGWWAAPLPGYAPRFLRSAAFGYMASAAFGAGLLIIAGAIVQHFAPPSAFVPRSGRRRRRNFLEMTVHAATRRFDQAFAAEAASKAGGLLQRIDARIKLAGMALLIVAATTIRHIDALVAIFISAILLTAASRIALPVLARRVWIPVLAFTGMVAAPALFLTAGPALAGGITANGLHTAVLLVLRAETAATMSVLLILCTPWPHLLRALRFFHVPVVVVVIAGMTYRYIFLFLQLAREMFESRQTRLVGVLEPEDSRRLAVANAGVLLTRSIQISQEVHTAMRARGYRGEVYLLDERRLRASDWASLAPFSLAVAGFIYWGLR